MDRGSLGHPAVNHRKKHENDDPKADYSDHLLGFVFHESN